MQLPHGKINATPSDGLDRSPLQLGDYGGIINASAVGNQPRPSPVPATAPAPTPAPTPAPIPNPITGSQGITEPPSLNSILGQAAKQRQLHEDLQQAKEELNRLKSMLPDVSPL